MEKTKSLRDQLGDAKNLDQLRIIWFDVERAEFMSDKTRRKCQRIYDAKLAQFVRGMSNG